jgi:hypothetical protein
MAKARNYAKENAWEDTPAQVKRREARNAARAKYAKAGKVHKGDGKEVDHKRFTRNLSSPLSNAASNLHAISRHANRIKQPKRKGR